MTLFQTIFDILVYVFFAWFMSNQAKKSFHYYPGSVKLDKYLWWFIGFYTIISAIRWRVGQDAMGYANTFIIGKIQHPEEWSMVLLVKFIHGLGLHFTIGIGVLAFLQIFFITKALSPYKYLLVFLPIVMFGSRYYVMGMNAMRQMIAAYVFLFLSKYIIDKKPVYYFVGIILAMSMHHSALWLIPIYFLPLRWIKIADRRILLFAIFIVCFVVGLTPQFRFVVDYGYEIFSFMDYEKDAEYMIQAVLGEVEEGALSFGPMQLSYFFIALINIWFGPILKQKFEQKIPYFNMWYFFSYIWACMYFLVCNVSHMYYRPFMYFMPFEMIILSLVLYELNQHYKANKLVIYLVTFIIWVSISWDIIKAESHPRWENVTYKVFFMHMDEVRTVSERFE